MRIITLILLILSVLANAALAWGLLHLYQRESALRLDPLQLTLYQSLMPAKSAAKLRVVFYGDSRALSWPSPSLEGYEFINRGIGQQTSAQIRARLDAHLAPLQADIVILQLCVNDLKTIPLFPAQYNETIQACLANTQAIIKQAMAQGTQVIVTTVFPLGKVPIQRWPIWSDAVAQSIREVNTALLALQGEKVQVWDTFSLLQGETGLIRPEYSRDFLHLNAQGYEVLNQGLKPILALRFQAMTQN